MSSVIPQRVLGLPVQCPQSPQEPVKIPPDRSPHYLPISDLTLPSDGAEMEGFTVEMKRKTRETIKTIQIPSDPKGPFENCVETKMYDDDEKRA